MPSIRDKQQETIATVDGAKAITDKILPLIGVISSSPTTYPLSPIRYLLDLLKDFITPKELKEWLSRFLIYVLPAVEISVKSILLTNLKNMISCSVDPRIPDKYRYKADKSGCGNAVVEDSAYGFNISVEGIDFFDKLSENPLSDYGKNLYFGLDGIEDVYKFARAEDFDAFLWFVMHRGKFPNSSEVTINGSSFSDNVHGSGSYTVTPSDGTLLDMLILSSSPTSPSTIMLGNTFKYQSNKPNIISMCIDRQLNENNNTIENTLLPTSVNSCSVNWYIRRADQLSKNLGFTKSKGFEGRDFSKERGICNIQSLDTSNSEIYPSNGLVSNALRMTILPKPYVHVPNIDAGEPPWRFTKLLFDSDGTYNPNGKYTIAGITQEGLIIDGNEKYITFKIGNETVGCKLSTKSGNIIVDDKSKIIPNLIESYKGLTVYEFNYDFIMGMKLFDAKTMANALIESLINLNIGLRIGTDKKHQEASDEIREIVKNIIETDESSEDVSCYFKFDNSKYEALLRKSEERRAKQYSFGDTSIPSGSLDRVVEILNEYDEATSIDERMEIVNRAITEASVTLSQGLNEKDRYNFEFGFVFDLIENLVVALMNAVLSPKVMMLLEVNRQLMGGSWKAFTIGDLLKSMQSIIVAITKEIRDLILSELLKFLLKQLEPLKETIMSAINREQIDNYVDTINDLIRNCPFFWFRFGGSSNQDLETKLDTVDYADIDMTKIINGEMPSIKC